MYNSIKPWINVPFQIKPFISRSGSGAKQFGDTLDVLCYPESDVKIVTDENGAEVVSTTQLYVDGSVPIKVTDDVVFENETRPVHRVNSFYRNGTVDLKVVYL